MKVDSLSEVLNSNETLPSSSDLRNGRKANVVEKSSLSFTSGKAKLASVSSTASASNASGAGAATSIITAPSDIATFIIPLVLNALPYPITIG